MSHLVSDDGTGCSASIGSNDDAAIVQTANDGGSGTGGLWQGDAAGMQGQIAIVQ